MCKCCATCCKNAIKACCCCDGNEDGKDCCITIDDNEGCDCFGCVLCGWQYGTGGCCLEDKDGHTWACILCEIQINCCTPCIVMVPLLVGAFHCSYFTCCCVKKTVAGAATTAGVVSKQPQGTRIP